MSENLVCFIWCYWVRICSFLWDQRFRMVDSLTRVEALHPQGQPGLGNGNELQSDVELAPPEMTQPSGSTQLCDLNPHTRTICGNKDKGEQLTTLYSCETLIVTTWESREDQSPLWQLITFKTLHGGVKQENKGHVTRGRMIFLSVVTSDTANTWYIVLKFSKDLLT